jgi:hypothetical protein
VYTVDVKPEVPVTKVGDAGVAYAVLNDTEDACDVVEPLYGNSNIDPRIKALAS